MEKNLLFIVFMLLSLNVSSQDIRSNFLRFTEYESVCPSDFLQKNGLFFQTNIGTGLKYINKSKSTTSNVSHHKYQQYYKNLFVVGGEFNLNMRNGLVSSSNGHIISNFDQKQKIILSSESAVAIAIQSNPSDFNLDPESKVELCYIDKAYPSRSNYAALSYKVDLSYNQSVKNERVYVDVTSGSVIARHPLSMNHNVPSTVSTMYYGDQEVTTDSIGPDDFALRDLSRGDGIFVYSGIDDKTLTNQSSDWTATNTADIVAFDAHYCSQEFYDLLFEDFSWSGLDGHGSPLISYVNRSAGASGLWDGTAAFFDHGDCNHGPLTTLEIVGHEFMHGVIQHSSGLAYSGESGGINECLADIFGKLLEYKSDNNNFSWEVGHSFVNDGTLPFRIMDDPAQLNLPTVYNGTNWPTDGFSVHTYSSIGNLWFSMISDGKSGINEDGLSYNVEAIGIENAGQIVFLANKNYLISTSDYNDFYYSTVGAAEDLFGVDSDEVASVKEAWKAVGVPFQIFGSSITDLAIGRSLETKFVCYDQSSFLDQEVQVANVGTTPYFPSMGASINLSGFGLTDYTIALEDTLQPGERMFFNIDNWANPAPQPGYAILGQLQYDQDENPTNNGIFSIYNISTTETDMAMYTSLVNSSCGSGIKELNISFENRNCSSFDVGTPVTVNIVSLETGQSLWEKQYLLDDSLDPYESIRNTYKIDFSTISDEFVLVSIDVPGDLYLFNNEDVVVVPNNTGVDQTYQNTFASDPKEALEFEFSSRILGVGNVEYQGNTYLGVTGHSASGNQSDPCIDQQNINHNNLLGGSYNATLRLCLDASAMIDPFLSFDMIKFYNDPNDLPENRNSALLGLRIEGSHQESYVFSGENEGELTFQEIEIPNGFQGEVIFVFYTDIGSFQGLTIDNFSNDDFILLDNLSISEGSLDVDNIHEKFELNIFPNPTHHNVTVRSSGLISQIEVLDIQGNRKMVFATNNHEEVLDLSDLVSGIYYIRVNDNEGDRIVRKVVVMK